MGGTGRLPGPGRGALQTRHGPHTPTPRSSLCRSALPPPTHLCSGLCGGCVDTRLSPPPPDLASRLSPLASSASLSLPPASNTLPLALWAPLSGKTLVVQVPLPPGVSLSVAFANKPLFFSKSFLLSFLAPVPPGPLFLSPPRARPVPSRASAPRPRCWTQSPCPEGAVGPLAGAHTAAQRFSSRHVATSGDGFGPRSGGGVLLAGSVWPRDATRAPQRTGGRHASRARREPRGRCSWPPAPARPVTLPAHGVGGVSGQCTCSRKHDVIAVLRHRRPWPRV